LIIGLSGYARSGKDEAAKVLVEHYGFRRVAFADKLRECLYELNPIVGISMWDRAEPEFILDMPTDTHPKVQDVIDYYGWDGYKETAFGPEIRRLLQRLGTEAGRKTLWDSIWVDAAFAGLEGEDVCVPDCRFENEYEAIKSRGGEVWRITRPGVGPANLHASETSLDSAEFDAVIENDGTLLDLKEKVVRFANERLL